jgi:purine-binding chemotaxis protein CheW
MNFPTKLDKSQLSRVPTNRYLRHQYSKAKSMRILTFLLGDQVYGIEFVKILETRRFEAIAAVAHLPDCFIGLIDIGKSIVPVVDLRARFKLPAIAYGSKTEIIILKLSNRMVGLVVDSISDFISTNEAKLVPLPKQPYLVDKKFLFCFATCKNQQLILVDIEHLMADKALMSETEINILNQLISPVNAEALVLKPQ